MFILYIMSRTIDEKEKGEIFVYTEAQVPEYVISLLTQIFTLHLGK